MLHSTTYKYSILVRFSLVLAIMLPIHYRSQLYAKNVKAVISTVTYDCVRYNALGACATVRLCWVSAWQFISRVTCNFCSITSGCNASILNLYIEGTCIICDKTSFIIYQMYKKVTVHGCQRMYSSCSYLLLLS